MTDEQAIELCDGLSRLLYKFDLGWIVDEVQSVIDGGKTQVKTSDSLGDDRSPKARRRSRVVGQLQRDWTNEERLALLLDATEGAVAGRALLAADIVTVLPELRGHWIDFAPDRAARDVYSVPLDGRVADRIVFARDLARVIETVRKELNADLD